MATAFDQSRVGFASVKVAKGRGFFCPSLAITFEVENESGSDVRLDRLVYAIEVQVDHNWSPTLGGGTYLESVTIPNDKTIPVTDEFRFDYEAVRQIDRQMIDHRRNIVWKIQVKGFFEGPSGQAFDLSWVKFQGSVQDQKPPWTPYSTWKDWVEGWQNYGRPQPYEYVEKLAELERKLATMVESAKTEMKISLSEGTEQSLTKLIEEAKSALRQERFEFEFLTTEPRGTDDNPLNKRLKQMIIQSAKSLDIMSPRVDRYYGEMKRAIEKGVKLRLVVQPLSETRGNRKKFKKVAIKDLKGVAKVREMSILHSRMVIGDGQRVLLTTADITQDGLVDQLNYGIYSSDPILVQESARYFEEVWKKP